MGISFSKERRKEHRVEYKSGNIYEGNWKDNKRHGYGKQTFKNGTTYECMWIDDNPSAEVKVNFSNGDIYQGNIRDYKYEGYGKYTYVFSGIGYYKGYWKNGEKNGHTVFDNGEIYDGDWKNGKRNGNGKMNFRDGSIIEGNWVKYMNMQNLRPFLVKYVLTKVILMMKAKMDTGKQSLKMEPCIKEIGEVNGNMDMENIFLVPEI